MQPRDSDDQCPEAGAGDGGRDIERGALEGALGVAITLLTYAFNGPVRVNEDGTVDLSARLTGSGGASA